jgi:maleylacetoacetate isomerase
MKLYTYARSSAAYRTRIALNLKGIDFDLVTVNLLNSGGGDQTSPDYLAVNPQGLVPTLIAEDTTITQSMAIIEYLEEIRPDPPLLPRAPVDRARVRAMALAVACDLHPLNNLRVLNYLRSQLGQDEDTVKSWYRHWIAVGLAGLEQEAKRSSADGRYMFGSGVTIADIYIVPQMFNARRFKCDIEPYPTLRGICEHLESLPAFAKAAPKLQPGFN